MKGILKPTESFMKALTLGYVMIALVGMFFIINTYVLDIQIDKGYREALVVGDSIMGSKCLAEVDSNGIPIKGIIEENSFNANALTCFNFPKGIYILLEGEGIQKAIGNSDYATEDNPHTPFPAILKTTTGELVPVRFTIYIEV
jgi:hypothetical protein